MYTTVYVCMSKNTRKNKLLPVPTVWVLGIKLRLLGLAASAFTHQLISVTIN